MPGIVALTGGLPRFDTTVHVEVGLLPSDVNVKGSGPYVRLHGFRSDSRERRQEQGNGCRHTRAGTRRRRRRRWRRAGLARCQRGGTRSSSGKSVFPSPSLSWLSEHAGSELSVRQLARRRRRQRQRQARHSSCRMGDKIPLRKVIAPRGGDAARDLPSHSPQFHERVRNNLSDRIARIVEVLRLRGSCFLSCDFNPSRFEPCGSRTTSPAGSVADGSRSMRNHRTRSSTS